MIIGTTWTSPKKKKKQKKPPEISETWDFGQNKWNVFHKEINKYFQCKENRHDHYIFVPGLCCIMQFIMRLHLSIFIFKQRKILLMQTEPTKRSPSSYISFYGFVKKGF